MANLQVENLISLYQESTCASHSNLANSCNYCFGVDGLCRSPFPGCAARPWAVEYNAFGYTRICHSIAHGHLDFLAGDHEGEHQAHAPQAEEEQGWQPNFRVHEWFSCNISVA